MPTGVPPPSADRHDRPTDILRLVRRVTNGVTGAELAHAASLGYRRYLDYQLDYARIDDSEVESFLTRTYPSLPRPADELAKIPQPTVVATLQEATLYRAAFSKRQLFERMVEFWTDHFSIAIEKVGLNKLVDDRAVIRAHALGNFGDLLRASSRSIAMLGYLDQFDSVAGSPNQNYARELLELHTVGVDGGYTQQDVAELSRVLTGWTFQRHFGGTFIFDPAIHDWGAKTVMGVAIPAAAPSTGVEGVQEGERVIDYLLAHPNTARFIATKLLKWLLTPTPTDAQVATVAGVYTATRGDIPAMVRATLDREWLRQAPLKFKRPVHYVASALRALAPAVHGMGSSNDYLSEVGQEPFMWETPDGYPDTLEYWGGGLLPRWNVANRMASEQSATQLHVDVTAYQAAAPDAAVARIDREWFGGALPAATRTALRTFARAGTWDDVRVRETLALALSAPTFQWY